MEKPLKGKKKPLEKTFIMVILPFRRWAELPAFLFTLKFAVDIVSKITQAIAPSLEAMGYSLVLVRLADGKRKTLSIMAERTDAQGMSFDDCTAISRTVSALLDVEDPIQTAYDLEVCSPGLDRPLTRAEDFVRFAGLEAKAESWLPIEGRKRFRGVIRGMQGDVIIMDMPEGEAKIPFSNIRTAKLVVTDTAAKKKKK
jgi:ribosome maturation factor RimP